MLHSCATNWMKEETPVSVMGEFSSTRYAREVYYVKCMVEISPTVYAVKVLGEFSPPVYTVKVLLCSDHW